MATIFVIRSEWKLMRSRAPVVALLVSAILLTATRGAMAQDTAIGVDVDKQSASTDAQALALDEGRLADRFERLERVMLRLAELSATSDPRRAEVLRRVVSQSKEKDVNVLFEATVKLLEEDRLGAAAKNQQTLRTELRQLLDLLLKENRADRLESEEKRIRRYLKEVNRLIRLQKGVKGQTEGGDSTDRLAKAQEKIGDKTGEIADEIGKDSESSGEMGGSAGESGEPSKRGGKEDEHSENDKGQEADSNDSSDTQDGSDGQGQQGQGQQGQGQQGQGQQNQGQQDGKEQQNDQRAQDQLREAQQRMEDAKRQLEQAKREGAAEDQQKALEALEQARTELEKILRQLREEQHEQLLAMLEARFRKMLDIQVKVYEDTQQLDQVPVDRRDHDEEIAAGRLSRQEKQLVHEADKAIRLLEQDGTSVAFPEAIEQMREDMRQVADRLARVQVGMTTQGIEEDIIAGLEEMIVALEKAQKDREARKGQPQQGEPVDPALVDQLAELKMIRSLQMRVNRRTERYSQMLAGSSEFMPELLEALRRLAKREQRIFDATRDLHLGKNR